MLYFPTRLSVCTSAVNKPTTPALHFESQSVPRLGDKRNFARRCGIQPAEPQAKDRVVVPTISEEVSQCAVLLRNAVLIRCVLGKPFLPFDLLAPHRPCKCAVVDKSPLESLRTGGSLCQRGCEEWGNGILSHWTFRKANVELGSLSSQGCGGHRD